jgi:glycosyltransferase involved in cell wall biosynthesis
MLKWNNNLCEPVLITFNRADCVDKTLEKFYKIRNTGMKFHVLDNCSTDNTEEIIHKWQEKWPELIYHKNQYNIGGNANILRAVELTNSKYIWIIGDDDEWYLDELSELIEVLNTQSADIIRLGWLVCDNEKGKYLPAEQLFNSEKFFFASVSMISSTIVRRQLVTPHLPWAYMNIANMYPQLVGIIKSFERQELSVYSMKQDLMLHIPSQEPGYFKADLEWYAMWNRTAKFFHDKENRKIFTNEAVRYMIRPFYGFKSELKGLMRLALNARAYGLSQSSYIAELFFLGFGYRFRTFCVAIAYLMLPSFMAMKVKRMYYFLRKRKMNTMKYDHSRI